MIIDTLYKTLKELIKTQTTTEVLIGSSPCSISNVIQILNAHSKYEVLLF